MVKRTWPLHVCSSFFLLTYFDHQIYLRVVLMDFGDNAMISDFFSILTGDSGETWKIISGQLRI